MTFNRFLSSLSLTWIISIISPWSHCCHSMCSQHSNHNDPVKNTRQITFSVLNPPMVPILSREEAFFQIYSGPHTHILTQIYSSDFTCYHTSPLITAGLCARSETC